MADTTVDFTSLESTQTDNSQQTVDTSQETQSNADQSQQTQVDQQQQSQQQQRINHRQIAKTLSELSPEHAQALKQMADGYYYHQDYSKVFPKPADAIAAKGLIDTLGGADGIAQLQERVSTFDMQDEMLSSGDPEVLESLFKDFPEGIVNLAAPFMERIAKVSPETFQSIVGPYAVDMMMDAGVAEVLRDAYQAQDPKPLIQKLYNWLAGQVNARDTAKPNVSRGTQQQPSRVQQEQAKLDKQREEIFSQGVQSKVNSIAQPFVDTEIGKIVSSYKLNEKQSESFRKQVIATVVEQLNGDEGYKKQVDIRKRQAKGKPDSVASYMATEFNNRVKDVAPEMARTLWGAPKAGGQTPSQNGGSQRATQQTQTGSSSAGPLKISRIPDNSELDTNRPDAMSLRIKGMGYTKDGRFVTWAHLRGH